jgi:DNA-binding transcriptional LysR family regulator
MNESQLKTLLWVVRLGGIGAAAQHLHMTQPAITRRIQELEKELGAPVLRREGRNVVPTALGQSCLQGAERILAEIAGLRMAASGKQIAGTIRIGVGEVIAMTWLYRLHARIEERYPNVRLEIDVDLSNRLLNKLLHDKIDMALLPGPTALPNVVRTDLGSVSLEWMAAPRLWTQDGSRPLTPAQLANLPIVTLPHDANVHDVMTDWFHRSGVRPPRVHCCNSINVVQYLVRQGLGISLMPPGLYREQLQAGTLVILPVTATLPKVGYAAVYKRGAGQSLAPELSLLPEISEFAREESWFLRKAGPAPAWTDA